MALGAYSSNLINEVTLDALLKAYNSQVKTDTVGSAVRNEINLKLFQNNPTLTTRYQHDSSSGLVATDSVAAAAGDKLFFEYANNGSNPLEFTTALASTVIVLGKDDAVNFVDNGPKTGADKGDIIVGGNANQIISVVSGNNTVLAGSGLDNLYGGSGKDSLVGGGKTAVYAGVGAQTLVGGNSASAADTLTGSSGADFFSVKAGSNFIVAGSGNSTIVSGDNGTGGHNGGDSISLLNGGNSLVKIGAGQATDSVLFGGSAGNDTIDAKGNVDVQIQHGEVLTGIDTKAGTTTLTFGTDHHLVYSGAGHVTITFQ
jgi:Ca2+-binding RTX toxin-like protein